MADLFQRRSLYTLSPKAEQERARRQWKDLELVKVIDAVRASSGRTRNQSTSTSKLLYALQEFERGGVGASLVTLQGTEFPNLVNDIIRYSKSDQYSGPIRKFLNSLGPIGKTISLISKAVSSARGGKSKQHTDPDVSAAINLLQAFGHEVLPPPSRRSQQTTDERGRAIRAAQELLESEGALVSWPGREVADAMRVPTAPPSARTTARDRKTVDLEIAGQKKRFPITHPIVTREKVPTPQSSNVQWFSYDLDTWTLYIRYQFPADPGKPPTHRDGPLYAYDQVPPQVFINMIQAPSKGGFVWSHIRERGTVSGHKYSYRLVAVTGGYVPRRATLKADGEWFEKRTIRTMNRKGQVKLQESKDSAPVYLSQPNRGQPNRGRPNRGK